MTAGRAQHAHVRRAPALRKKLPPPALVEAVVALLHWSCVRGAPAGFIKRHIFLRLLI
jgi:hypothetical protein